MRRDEHKQKGAAASCSGGARCVAPLSVGLEWQKGEMNGRDDHRERERKSDTQSHGQSGDAGGGQFSDPLHSVDV